MVLCGTCIRLGRKTFDTGIHAHFSAVASECIIHHVAIYFQMEKSVATVALLFLKKGWENPQVSNLYPDFCKVESFNGIQSLANMGYQVIAAMNVLGF